MEFHLTSIGKKLYEIDIPKLVIALNRIAVAVEESNELNEQFLKIEKKRLILENRKNETKTNGAV